MMKNYSPALIKEMQEQINAAAIQMQTYKDYTFLKRINTCDISIHFTEDPSTGVKDYVMFLKPEMDKVFLGKWKSQTAAGYFLPTDFKKDNRDFIGNTLYHKVQFTSNKRKYKVLVRLLNELTEDMSEEKRAELITKFGDVQIDNHFFSIIKFSYDDGTDIWSNPDILTNIKTDKDEEYVPNIIENALDPEEEKDDENLMNPLF